MNHFYLFFTYIKWKKKKKIVKKNVVCEGMKVKGRKREEKGERELKKRWCVFVKEKKPDIFTLYILKLKNILHHFVYYINYRRT